jgi:outer membrane protein, adhesin transport system
MLSLKRSLFILLLLSISVLVNAQQSVTPVTLKQLLNQVSQKAPTLITDSSAIRIRQAEAAETRSNWLPNLKLNYQADIGTSNNVIGPYFGFRYHPIKFGWHACYKCYHCPVDKPRYSRLRLGDL